MHRKSLFWQTWAWFSRDWVRWTWNWTSIFSLKLWKSAHLDLILHVQNILCTVFNVTASFFMSLRDHRNEIFLPLNPLRMIRLSKICIFQNKFHQTLNAHISLKKSELEVDFVLCDMKKCFLHISIIFGVPRPRGLTAGGSAPTTPDWVIYGQSSLKG